MSGTDTAIAELNEPTVEPGVAAAPPRPAALPYLSVANARDAIAWYVDIFGASVVGEMYEMDDGRIGHAELQIGDGVLYLADEYPEIGLKAPSPQASSVSLMLHVADTDARWNGRGSVAPTCNGSRTRTTARATPPSSTRPVTAGCSAGRSPAPRFPSSTATSATCRCGRRTPSAPPRSTATCWAGPTTRSPIRSPTPRSTSASSPSPARPTCSAATRWPTSRVPGSRFWTAAARSTRSQQFDFGTVLGATDSQGTSFAVFQPNPGQPRPELNGSGPGELSYITYEVPDSTAFKAFYSRVLFWTFEPGRIDDGWRSHRPTRWPGSQAAQCGATTVPMWTVEDVDAAVARVREAGGTVIEEPSQQPYGKTAQCTDDQGGRFYLGEF